MLAFTDNLHNIADTWFIIYEECRIKGDVNMISSEITKLVGGIDNHMAIIMYYGYMKQYINKKTN